MEGKSPATPEPSDLPTVSRGRETEASSGSAGSTSEEGLLPSEGPATFSLHEAIQIAIANRYELNVAQENIHMSVAELRAAKSDLYPSIDLMGRSTYTKDIDTYEPLVITVDVMGTKYSIFPESDVPEYRSDVTLALNQKLFSGGRIIKQIQGAQERTEKSKIGKEVEKRNIMLSVTEACWELKRAQRLADIAAEAAEQAEIVLNVAKSRCDKGAISRLERDKAESEVLRARLDMMQAESKRQIAVDELFRQMGIIGEKDYSIIISDEPELTVTPIEGEVNDLIERAISSRPEMQEIERDIRAKESDVKASESGYYPQLDLRGEYHWVGYDDEEVDDAWEDLEKDYWSVFLVAKYNLFEGFYTQSKTRQAKASLNAAKSQRDGTRTLIIHDVIQSYTILKSRSEELANAEKNVSIAQRNLDAVLKEFELGVATVDKVADYNIDLANARRRHIISLIDFEIAKARLKWAVGDELP